MPNLIEIEETFCG